LSSKAVHSSGTIIDYVSKQGLVLARVASQAVT
jgi:hypothetical protein